MVPAETIPVVNGLPICRTRIIGFGFLTILFFGCSTDTVTGDEIELVSGAKSRGTVVARTKSDVTIEIKIGSRTITRKYPLSRIHAITKNGKQEILNPKSSKSSSRSRRTTRTPASSGLNVSSNAEVRSKADVRKFVDEVGRTPPDWYESTELNYPTTLDLSWPMPAPKPWNNQKNIGQFIWDRINPNPGKWREGVRFLHHVLSENRGNRDVQIRAMTALGGMYHNLLEDYARAAFWWEKAGVDKSSDSFNATARLANCYWKLGNKQMALDVLGRMRRYPYVVIKILGDMGETERALSLADRFAKTARQPQQVYLLAGDVCRVSENYDRAREYYQKVLDAKPLQNKKYDKLSNDRARASLAAIEFLTLDVGRVKDGTYRAASIGYEGQVYVEVVVRSGKIESVNVTDHKEKQFYSSISDTTRKIVERQSVRGIDATTSATITSEAIINATAKALASGL